MRRRQTATKQQMRQLLSAHHVLSGPELVEKLPGANPSTIYRNLKRFVEDGIIREVTIGLGTAKYELAHDEHHHFVCNGCGAVEKITPHHAFFDTIRSKGYQIEEVNLFIRGTCGQCNGDTATQN